MNLKLILWNFEKHLREFRKFCHKISENHGENFEEVLGTFTEIKEFSRKFQENCREILINYKENQKKKKNP